MTARENLIKALGEEHHPSYWGDGDARDEKVLVAAFEAEVLRDAAAKVRATASVMHHVGSRELLERVAEDIEPDGGRDRVTDPTKNLAERIEAAIGLNVDCGGAEGVYRLRDLVMAEVQPVLDRLAEYESAICWETTCLSCSRMLDVCRLAEEKSEQAAAEHERVTAELMDAWSHEATPMHEELGRITMAAWNPHVDGNAFRELARAVVGHPLMSREDATAAAASLRAECRRVGIAVADTAEEQVARVREFAGNISLPGWVRRGLADALDSPPPRPECSTEETP